MATTLDIVLLLASSARLGLAALPPRLTRDGPAALWGFPGLSHQAVDYAPARGALGLTKPDMYTYIQTVATCESAMAAYNRTATTSAIYDETGARAPGAQVGAGTPLCICFSLGGAPGKMDLCVHVLGDGTPEGRGTLWYDDIAGGTYVSNANKALPQCGDIDVAAVSASVYAALGAASPTANAAGASGAPGSSGAAAPGRTVYATAPAAADGSDGLSRSDKIALGVGLGMVSDCNGRLGGLHRSERCN